MATTFAGCVAPDSTPPCDADGLVQDGVAYLATTAHATGGVPPAPGGEPDPRTTAWVLLAAGLARRTGHEGAFDSADHVRYLGKQVSTMAEENVSIDSAANNLSLARVALQVWGRTAAGVTIDDPAYPEARTLAEAWEARYDRGTGTYGTRLNEHLFGAFGAWLFEPAGPRLHAMARAVHNASQDATLGPDGLFFDAWFTGYARVALGPVPPTAHRPLADALEENLDARQDHTGGVVGFRSADTADASSTAAALLGWGIAGEGTDGEHVSAAISYLCDLRRGDGSIPFSVQQDIARTKTTAEVVIAVAVLIEPVPWG